MGKIKDVRGQFVSENLLVLDIKKENNRIYYFCECQICKNRKWLRSDSAKRNKSCGCLQKQTQFTVENLSGQVFGRLTVTNEYKIENKCTYWLCKCECGNHTWVPIGSLKEGRTKSCGCIQSELASQRGKKLGKELFEKYKEKNLIQDTNISVISRKEVRRNNTSRKTGVCFDKSKNKWVAKLTFQGKIHNLGAFTNKEDAIAARQKAEEEYFEKFLKELDNEV